MKSGCHCLEKSIDLMKKKIYNRSLLLVPGLLILAVLALVSLLAATQVQESGCDIKTANGSDVKPFLVLGYYPVYFSGRYPISRLNLDAFNALALAFADIGPDGSLLVRKNFFDWSQIKILHDKKIRVILSVGGWGQGKNFPRVAADPMARQRFADSAMKFLLQHDLDGVDLDWEFPRDEQQKKNFVLLTEALRQRWDRQHAVAGTKRYILTAALGASPFFLKYYDLPALQKNLDYLFLMTYDYHGPWAKLSGHNAPLRGPEKKKGLLVWLQENLAYAFLSFYNPFQIFDLESMRKRHQDQQEVYYDTFFNHIEQSFSSYKEAGLKQESACLGLPFYGRSFDTDSLYNPFRKTGYHPFRDILKMRQQKDKLLRHFDPVARVPFLTNSGESFLLSYDNARSIKEKISFARRQGMGGVIVWEVTQDILDNGQTPLQDVLARCRQRLSGQKEIGVSPGLGQQRHLPKAPSKTKLNQEIHP